VSPEALRPTGVQYVVGYVRVSTGHQAETGVSIDAQKDWVRGWAGARNATLAGLYEDAGISGKRADNRPGLQAALEQVCRVKGVLVVYSLSRLARSIRDALAIADRLERAGADLVSLTEPIDTTTPYGRFFFKLLAILAELERDILSERTKGALAYKRGQGERTGGVPYGFDLGDDGKTLLKNEREQKVLARIREWHGEGKSLRRIAGVLNALQIPTKVGGTKWGHTSVARIVGRTS
jgi:site-specific DNA recombinase